jgi:hypothetical protein
MVIQPATDASTCDGHHAHPWDGCIVLSVVFPIHRAGNQTKKIGTRRLESTRTDATTCDLDAVSRYGDMSG